jgi:EAL domain-containing protein (putative c-di-GMP-specific phosphodiesterase class I)/GGDEF domain-containing protein
MFIGNCNVTAELVSLIVAGFLTFLMLYSNPRKTSSYQIIHYGILLSMISIATQLAFFYSQAHTDMFNRELRLFLSLAFLAEYLALLMMLYVYICLLSTRTLHHTKNLQSKVLSFGCTYAIAVFAFAVSGKLPDIIDGLLPLEYYINFYAIFGIITCLICLLSILLNKHSIPKVVNKYALIFIPVDFIMLSVQFMTSNIIFSSLTYVLPFLIYYILFHSNPYDELIGCQNMHSFEARFTDSVSMKRKFLVVYLNFPQLKNVNYAIHNEKVEETAANVCRRIEKLHHMVHIYRFTNDEFAMILYIKDENKIKQFLNNVEMAIIDYMTASSYTINYRIAAIQSNPVVSSTHKLSSMSAYLFNKIANEPGNQCYLATDKDYKKFHEAYKIEQLLLDIRNKNDLDDERVLCYAQPIFSVNNNSFRTAEALMRLSLDGTIIYPDKFIPIAEKNNCIHTLTRIILNKVCKIVAEFEKKYDFDAITINCSSSELSNRNLFDELMAIINSNNIMPEHIRLELTESAMFDDFNMVIHNMEKLNESGIKFYLDDFGTGYSNLERIIGCPFNTIKFDKTLLYKSLDNSAVSDIVSHLTSVFKEQGFVLLIEGVENEEQASYSIDKGFDYIQGYKYAKPQPVINLKDYFDKLERAIS